MALDLKGQRQSKGYLEAVELLGAKDNNGMLWRCLCHFCGGKNHRNVLARDFTSGRIRKCESCINPTYRKRQKQLVKQNRRVKSEKLRELGPPFITTDSGFRANLDATIRSFSPRRRLLFEAILDGRDSIFEYRLQALEWALQIKESELEFELRQLTHSRIYRAAERLLPSGSKLALAA